MLADDLECGVCLLDFPASASYTLSSCGHTLHRPCLRENAAQRLRAGDTSLACYEPGCGLALLDSDLATLLDGEEGAETMRRLARRRLERSEPSIRFCPAAGCDSEVRGGSAQSPELTCRSCGTGFCFLHNTAHAAGRAACQAYVLRERTSPEHAASLAEIGRNSRPCPRPACGTLVERAGGCNSIVCARCGATFCWLCGVEITPGELPIHYQVSSQGGGRGTPCALPLGSFLCQPFSPLTDLTSFGLAPLPPPVPLRLPPRAPRRAVVEPQVRLPLSPVCGHWRPRHLALPALPAEPHHSGVRPVLWHTLHGDHCSAVRGAALLQHPCLQDVLRGPLCDLYDPEQHRGQPGADAGAVPAGSASGAPAADCGLGLQGRALLLLPGRRASR